jgi:hypothetical protein
METFLNHAGSSLATPDSVTIIHHLQNAMDPISIRMLSGKDGRFETYEDMLTGNSAAVFSHYLIDVEAVIVSCDVSWTVLGMLPLLFCFLMRWCLGVSDRVKDDGSYRGYPIIGYPPYSKW